MLNKRAWKKGGFFALALAGMTCFAQNAEAPKEPPKFYKLEFVVKELDAGKVVNARSYSMTAATNDRPSQTHTTSQVRVPTSPGAADFMQVGVGVNIDSSSLKEMKNELSLGVRAEITSIVQEPTANPGRPIIRQNNWQSTVIVPIRKSTVIFSSDDTATKHQMQMELTATPIE